MFEVYKEILQITKKKKQVNRNLGKKRNQAFCKKETWFKKKKKKTTRRGSDLFSAQGKTSQDNLFTSTRLAKIKCLFLLSVTTVLNTLSYLCFIFSPLIMKGGTFNPD